MCAYPSKVAQGWSNPGKGNGIGHPFVHGYLSFSPFGLVGSPLKKGQPLPFAPCPLDRGLTTGLCRSLSVHVPKPQEPHSSWVLNLHSSLESEDQQRLGDGGVLRTIPEATRKKHTDELPGVWG